MSFPTVKLPDFRGLCKDFETGTLLPGQSPDMQDVRLTIRREIQKMAGYDDWNTNQNPEGAVEIKGGFDYQKWDTNTRRVLVGTKTKMYALSQKANILTANQSDVETNTTGFTAIGAGTITRDTNNYYQGTASLKIVTGAVSGDGGKVDAVSASAATAYTASVYVKGTSGDVIKFVLRDNTNGTETSTTKTMNGKWQRVSVSHTTGALAVADLEFHITNNAAADKTVYADAFMVEAATYAGHWTRGGDSGWTSLLTSTSELDTEFWEFAYADDLVVFCNGLDKPYFWDGLRTTAQSLGGNVWETFQSINYTSTGWASQGELHDRGVSIAGLNVVSELTNVSSFSYFGNTWDVLSAKLTGGGRSGSGFFTDEGVVNVVGGYSGATYNATHEEYSLDRNVWATLTALTTATDRLNGFAIGIKLYVGGGTTAATPTGVVTFFEYDRLTKVWTAKDTLNSVRADHSAFAVDRGYFAGGYDGAAVKLNTSEYYDVDTNTWTAASNLSSARYQGAGASLSSTSGVIGLGLTTGGAGNFDCDIYDMVGNAWVGMASTTLIYQIPQEGFNAGGVFHIAGGVDSGGIATTVSRRYVPPNRHQPAQFVIYHLGQLHTFGDPDNPSRGLYTDVNQVRTQRANAFINYPLDRITSAFKFQGTIHVLSRDRGVRVHGTRFDPDLTVGNQFVEEVPQMPGCVSHRSGVTIDALGIRAWWSEDGPVVWDGSKAVKLAERYLNGEPRGLIRFFADTANFAQSQHKYIIAHHLKKYSEVWWQLTTTGTTKDDWYLWNYGIDECYGPINIPMASVFEVEDLNTDLPLMLMGSYSGRVYQNDTGNTYDSVAINGRYRTDVMIWTPLLDLFAYDILYTLAKQSGAWDLTVKSFRDWSSSADKTVTQALSGTNKLLEFLIAGGNVNGLQVEWSNANADEPFTVLRAELGMRAAV